MLLMLRVSCLILLTLSPVWNSYAQTTLRETTEAVAVAPSLTDIEQATTLPGAPSVVEQEPEQSEPFRLPAEHHVWARFQPGAWRELRTVSETFDEVGQIVSRNTTTLKEVLQAVSAETYALHVQATVELPGKRVVGDWKTRILDLATDSANSNVESRRLEDQPYQVAGPAVSCQVWELRYRDEALNLVELIHYDPMRFPFVMKRETLTDTSPASGEFLTDRLVQVTAQELPFQWGEQMIACACERSYRHRAKGDTHSLRFISPTVPGGELAAWSTDYDAQGQRVRWSVTSLVASGTTPPDDSPPIADP